MTLCYSSTGWLGVSEQVAPAQQSAPCVVRTADAGGGFVGDDFVLPVPASAGSARLDFFFACFSCMRFRIAARAAFALAFCAAWSFRIRSSCSLSDLKSG